MASSEPSIRAAPADPTAISESFNAKLRDELLNGEIFYSLEQARIVGRMLKA